MRFILTLESCHEWFTDTRALGSRATDVRVLTMQKTWTSLRAGRKCKKLHIYFFSFIHNSIVKKSSGLLNLFLRVFVCLSAKVTKLITCCWQSLRQTRALLIIYLKLLTLGSRTSNYTNYLHNKQSVFSIFTEVWKPGSNILSTLIRFFFA